MAAALTWYYQTESGVVGPISAAELKRLVEKGVVRSTTRIRRGEDGSWFPAEGIQVVLGPDLAAEVATTSSGEPVDCYFSLQDKRKLGPVARSVLEAMFRQGKLWPVDLVWCPGMAAWAPASEVLSPLHAAKPSPPGQIHKPPGPPRLVRAQTSAEPPRRDRIKKSRPGGPTGRTIDRRLLFGEAALGVFLLGAIAAVGWSVLRTGTGNPAVNRTAPQANLPAVAGRAPPDQRQTDVPVKAPDTAVDSPASANPERLYDDALKALRQGDHFQARKLLEQYAAIAGVRQAEVARRVIKEIELASSSTKADELAEDLSEEQLRTYLRESVARLVASSLQTQELRPLYTETLRQALEREDLERKRNAKNNVLPIQAAQPAGSPNSPPSQPAALLKTAETAKGAPITKAESPKGERESRRSYSPDLFTLDRVLDEPDDFVGQTLVADGLYKIGTHLYNVKGADGNPVGWSLPVTRDDGGRICSGEAKALGRDTYLLLENGLAQFLERVFVKLRLRATVKPIHKCILTVAIRSPINNRELSPVVYITALEILGDCDLYKVINNEYEHAFTTAKISPGKVDVGRGKGLLWVDRLGGEEKYVQPLRRRFKEIQRRQRDLRDQAMVDRYIQMEHSKIMALTAAAHQQQARAFAAWMGRPMFP
jgi:hypothetical protein